MTHSRRPCRTEMQASPSFTYATEHAHRTKPETRPVRIARSCTVTCVRARGCMGCAGDRLVREVVRVVKVSEIVGLLDRHTKFLTFDVEVILQVNGLGKRLIAALRNCQSLTPGISSGVAQLREQS